MSPTTPEDPKGIAGLAKPQLQLVPPVINTAMAAALKIGADKYGPWNWRTNKVEIMTYLGAMRRHIDAVLEGEDLDPESGAHHLGHVAAGCAIVLDALAHGTLVDNRPPRRIPVVNVPFDCDAPWTATDEAPFDPNDDLAEYLAARKRMRDAMTPAEELPPLEVLHEGGKKLTWGQLFPDLYEGLQPYQKTVLDKLEDSLLPPRQMDKPSRPILVADEPAPTNLDALANHIDEVVNEFPTEPLDPHA